VTSSPAKICLLPPKLGLGGPASFQAGLIEAFNAAGVAVTHDPTQNDLAAILVFGAGARVETLRNAQRAGLRVVQRLNGMNWVHRRKYTGVRHFIKAEAGNLKLREVRKLADRVIYQSRFALEWWESEHGVLDKPQAVIHNGVDLQLFTPQPTGHCADCFRILMVEAHHGGGFDQGLRSGVGLVERLNGTLDRPVELVVVGQVPASIQREYTQTWVTWLGVVDHAQIPAIDRSAHLFFSGDINAACPNAVLEALACGLPVVAYDTGSMNELINRQVGRLVPYGGDVWKLDLPDADSLAGAAREILVAGEDLPTAARAHAVAHFDIQDVADRYLKILLGN
jgi:glycosyltransferase involved in cell wall biosynthesis